MKLLTTISVVTLLAAASASVDAGQRGKLYVTNDAKNSVAVGGELMAASATPFTASGIYASGKRAHAGSVIVNGCQCYKKAVVVNKSRNAIALGAATAGSVVLNNGY